ncbi:MAG: phosphoribosylamine--glycine ligase, partial [Acidimicrobiia bacterium]|nr:phosphoribosylamine--glycine ligase [Acidimicrobiia bacterium]
MTKVLIVGNGGREHAMAWAASRSPRVDRVIVAPGNAGWPETVDIAIDDVAGIVSYCTENRIDLVMVGPEAALAAGVVDGLRAAGISAFGPTKAACELEWSKAAARQFCERHGIASPAYAVFTDAPAALEWVRTFGRPVVVKASGLAAGKGVIVPADASETEAGIATLLASFGEIVLEERLEGEEVSLMAFSDGSTVRTMPPAQDHKRIGEGDTGLNTGGMGAFAPTPICPPALVEQLTASILQPTIDALRAEGRPYVGVLYAGLMLTADGPKVLEFNCRFGDPETQVVLPLLDSDLVEIALACVNGHLDDVKVSWRPDTACAVVLAAANYPGTPITGTPIKGNIADHSTDTFVFHAGTVQEGSQVRTAGGRVLAVTAVAPDLTRARERAYKRAASITFEGRQMRRDIGWRALARTTGGYAASGVDID